MAAQGDSAQAAGGGTGTAILIAGSLFNHSCEPNVDVVVSFRDS